jgi:RecB family exonuclease
MQGYIDRIAQRDDGTYEIHDYKTTRHLATQQEADQDQQLALYQIGLSHIWNDTGRVELVWHYLRYDKEIRSRRTPEQLEAVKAKCIALIDDIESRGKEEASFPTCRGTLCDWCAFRCQRTGENRPARDRLEPARVVGFCDGHYTDSFSALQVPFSSGFSTAAGASLSR